MANDKLPTPATAQDMYSNAIVTELQRLNASLKKLVDTLTPDDTQGDEVTLKEPDKPSSKKATTKGK